MESSHPESPEPTDEEIALCAYRIWLREGCPQGRDKEQWLEARANLLAARANKNSHDERTSGETSRAEQGAA